MAPVNTEKVKIDFPLGWGGREGKQKSSTVPANLYKDKDFEEMVAQGIEITFLDKDGNELGRFGEDADAKAIADEIPSSIATDPSTPETRRTAIIAAVLGLDITDENLWNPDGTATVDALNAVLEFNANEGEITLAYIAVTQAAIETIGDDQSFARTQKGALKVSAIEQHLGFGISSQIRNAAYNQIKN